MAMKRPNRNIEIFSMSVLDMFASALGAFILITIILFPNQSKMQQVQQELEQARQQVQAQQEQIAQLQAQIASQQQQVERQQQQMAAQTQQIQAQAQEIQAQAQEIERDRQRIAQQEAQLRQMQAQLQQAQSQLQQSQAQVQAQQAQLQQAQAQMRQQQAQLQQQTQQMRAMEQELSKTFIVVTIEWSVAGRRNDIDLHITDPSGNEFYFVKPNLRQSDFPNSEAQLSRDSTSGPGIEVWQIPVAVPGAYKIEYVYYQTEPPTTQIPVDGNIYTRKGRIKIPTKTLTFSESRPKVPAATVMVEPNGDVSLR